MSILQKLTEGIQHRDVGKEGAALLAKWEKTGLLEGLGDERTKNTMSVLLENQAKELLREASSMAAGDVEGFASVAFPIVRRVFGGLIANDLVSVQPMSLPSGLIFFLDFTKTDARDGRQNQSLYGGNVVGRQITGGVDLSPSVSQDAGGFYDLAGGGYTSATGSFSLDVDKVVVDHKTSAGLTEADKKALQYDPDLLDNLATNTSRKVVVLDLRGEDISSLSADGLKAVLLRADGNYGDGNATMDDAHNCLLVRRLTRFVPKGDSAGGTEGDLRITLISDTVNNANAMVTFDTTDDIEVTGPVSDNLVGTDHIGAIKGASEWALEGAGIVDPAMPGQINQDASIPEIDIKVDSIAVTAQTKKLKAKWTPELGQDLNAYHNLDAEVELTGILSEQIALEIDQEILGDLINGAKAGTRYWSRAPGLFVDQNGSELGAASAAPDFTGTVSEWYETLIETINDVSAQIHRKTLRGGANFVVCSPEVANILEFTSGFRASVTADADKGTIGAVKAGSLSKKFDVMVDPYFPRNVILVGRKGSSFLESGFVYAPYVPLQVTPTIFGTEDFVPRKGVMTRYAKKMVRPDMYGLVVVRGLLGEQGAS